ncbi:MAG: hypothetical protein RIS35_2430 [Pseudomonadota bacterium]
MKKAAPWPDGTVFFDGEPLPDLFERMPTPVSYGRMIWRDGKPYDYVYLYVNPAFERTFGFGPVIGRLASEVVPGFRASRRPILGIYGRVASGGGSEGFDVYVEHYRKWLSAQAFSPRPNHFVAVFNATGEKIPGGLLRSTFDAMAEGFFVRDRDGRIIDHNPAALRIMGLSEGRLHDRIALDPGWRAVREDLSTLPPDEHPSMITLRTGEPLRNRIVGLSDPQGVIRWISVNTQPIGDSSSPDYVVTTFVDITHSRESERQRLTTLESMGDGFLCLDADWRFVYVNEAAERMLGASREQLLGRSHWDLYPKTCGTEVETAFRRAAAGERACFENFYEPWQRWFQGRCYPRPGSGILVYFVDVTETREAQEALRRSHDELRSLVGQMNAVEERERVRIARELHDELQQSLAAARLDVLGIRRRLAPGDAAVDDLVASATHTIDLAIDATRRIIGDLRPAILDELGLAAALDEMVERLRARTGIDAGFEVLGARSADAELPREVTICLYRIAQESLNNVGKHAQASSMRLTLDLRRPEAIGLEVRDDGRGILPDDLGKRGSFGVLGMRERLHALGGDLTISSDPGAGTTVRAVVGVRATPGDRVAQA